MKKYIFLFLILLVAVYTAPIKAEEGVGQVKQEVMVEKQERIQLNATQGAMVRSELKERVKTKLEVFKAKLGLIKDERKQKITERINTQLTHLNQQVTTNLAHLLTRLRALMDKLSVRIDVAKTEGLNIVKAEEAMISSL